MRLPAITRVLAFASFRESVGAIIALTSNPKNSGFSPRYVVSSSPSDPFDSDRLRFRGENYAMLVRWAEFKFAEFPTLPLYLWDTQSTIANRADGLPIFVNRKFTTLLSPDGFLSRTAIAIEGN